MKDGRRKPAKETGLNDLVLGMNNLSCKSETNILIKGVPENRAAFRLSSFDLKSLAKLNWVNQDRLDMVIEPYIYIAQPLPETLVIIVSIETLLLKILWNLLLLPNLEKRASFLV